MSPTMTPEAPTKANEPTVAVRVVAADPGTQVTVFDSAFRTVASGIGRLSPLLPRGIYKARFNTGDRLEDVLFEVDDVAITINGPALSFSSPIPLSNTSTNHEYHYHPSRDLASKAPIALLGSGGQVFVFARDSRQPYDQPPPGPPQWQGLCIRNASHVSVFDIDPNGVVARPNGFVAAKLELNPGLYFLEQPDCAHPDMVLKLPFVVCAGWCTHIYVDSKDSCAPNSPSGPSIELRRALDLAGAAMVMLRLNGPAQLDEDVARLSEVARQALMRSQEGVSEQVLEEMLDGKWEFPMLGLYAAHVLLSRSERNWQKVARIVENLARWLGSGHPDVDVLMALCTRHGVTSSHTPSGLWPPLLAASWDLATSNKVELGNKDGRNDWQRQYRIGGSMWSCLYAPKRLGEIAANRVTRNTSFNTGAFSKVKELAAAASAVLSSAPSAPSAPAAQPPNLPAPDWKRKLTTALLRPNPDWPPFEQAVRRRVLDLIGDEHEQEKLSLEDIGRHVAKLAKEFQVPDDEVDDVVGKIARQIWQ